MARGPVRTCVGCRRRADKATLLRVVAGPDGDLRADPTGREPGRGAYLHRDEGCVDAALARGALTRALHTGSHAGGAARLREAVSHGIAADPGGTTETEGQ